MEDILQSLVLAIEPNKQTAGYTLFYVHLTCMFLLPILFIGVTLLRIPILICYFPLYVYHILKKGCPVTRVERRLHGENRTVIDVFLGLLGIKPSNENRNKMLMFLSTMFMVFMVYVISIMST